MKFTFKDGVTVEVKDTEGKSKKQILDEAKRIHKEFKKTTNHVVDSFTRNWEEMIYLNKNYEIDSLDLIMYDMNNDGEYDLAIYIDGKHILDTVDAGHTPAKQWGSDYYEADPEEYWFDWEIKAEDIEKVYIGDDEISLTEEDKKEIAGCLMSDETGVTRDYQIMLEENYNRISDSKTVKDSYEDLSTYFTEEQLKNWSSSTLAFAYITGMPIEDCDGMEVEPEFEDKDVNEFDEIESIISRLQRNIKDSKKVKDSKKKIKDDVVHIIETERDPSYAVMAEYDEYYSDYSNKELDKDEIYSYEDNMLCSFDELIDALFKEVTDDTIRVNTLKEYYDTDFEEHKDELVYELKSEPGKYYTLEEIDEDYKGIPSRYDKYYVEEH